MALVTVDEVKEHMGLTTAEHDAELLRLCNTASVVVQEHAGPTLEQGTFTETSCGGRVLLQHRPVVSVVDGTVVDGGVGYADLPAGATSVTYTAGLSEVPEEAVDAALLYVSWRYRRNHGGSETYMPAAYDGVAPMGTAAIGALIRQALGPLARGPRVG